MTWPMRHCCLRQEEQGLRREGVGRGEGREGGSAGKTKEGGDDVILKKKGSYWTTRTRSQGPEEIPDSISLLQANLSELQ